MMLPTEKFSQNALLEKENELLATFWEHLEALRKMLICVISVIALGFILCLTFYSPLLQLIFNPLNPRGDLTIYEVRQQRIVNQSKENQIYAFPSERFQLVDHSSDVILIKDSTFRIPPGSHLEISSLQTPNPLALFSPLEGMKTTLKVCFWTSIVLTSPFWLFFIAQFIAPAFKKNQRRLFFPFLIFSLLFLGIGSFFAWTISLPLANEMFYAFNEEIGINLWSYTHYIDYSFILLLANALAFEIAFIVFFFVHIGLLTPEFMQTKRKVMILAAFVLGALLTPPDVITQIMLAIPLIALYELALFYARLRQNHFIWKKNVTS